MNHADRLSFIDVTDVDIVLGRLPSRCLDRLGDISLCGNSKGGRRLGFGLTHGRRDVTLCARLPIRISMRELMREGARATDFGAPDRGQWPPWAVRRLMLYSVLLHEIGHLQVVRDSPRDKRRFASETLANAFANDLRGELYSTPFEHTDPVHNAPTDQELAMIPWWESLDKEDRGRLALWVCGDPRRPALLDIEVDSAQAEFLARARIRRQRFLRLEGFKRSQRSVADAEP